MDPIVIQLEQGARIHVMKYHRFPKKQKHRNLLITIVLLQKKKKKKHPAIVHTKYKYSVDQLPELLDYMYNIRNRSAKYKIVEAWKDEKLRIEICSNLEDLGQNRPLPRIKKSLKGHKNLYELKFNKMRVIIDAREDEIHEIIAICQRRDLKSILESFSSSPNSNYK